MENILPSYRPLGSGEESRMRLTPSSSTFSPAKHEQDPEYRKVFPGFGLPQLPKYRGRLSRKPFRYSGLPREVIQASSRLFSRKPETRSAKGAENETRLQSCPEVSF